MVLYMPSVSVGRLSPDLLVMRVESSQVTLLPSHASPHLLLWRHLIYISRCYVHRMQLTHGQQSMLLCNGLLVIRHVAGFGKSNKIDPNAGPFGMDTGELSTTRECSRGSRPILYLTSNPAGSILVIANSYLRAHECRIVETHSDFAESEVPSDSCADGFP